MSGTNKNAYTADTIAMPPNSHPIFAPIASIRYGTTNATMKAATTLEGVVSQDKANKKLIHATYFTAIPNPIVFSRSAAVPNSEPS